MRWACGWGVQAPFDIDLGLGWGDGWLGWPRRASPLTDLTGSSQINAENDGGGGISGKEKENERGKKERRKRKGKKKFDFFEFLIF